MPSDSFHIVTEIRKIIAAIGEKGINNCKVTLDVEKKMEKDSEAEIRLSIKHADGSNTIIMPSKHEYSLYINSMENGETLRGFTDNTSEMELFNYTRKGEQFRNITIFGSLTHDSCGLKK